MFMHELIGHSPANQAYHHACAERALARECITCLCADRLCTHPCASSVLMHELLVPSCRD